MIKIYSLRFCLFTLLACTILVLELKAQVSFPGNSAYRFLKGSEAAALERDWFMPSFDDSSWPVGQAPFQYGDGFGGTILPDMQGNYSTLYLRTTFNAKNANLLGDILCSINYDDGFAIWINGHEVLNQNAPEDRGPNSLSTASHESSSAELFSIFREDVSLQEGINTLAVQCFNVDIHSSDLHFSMSMNAQVELPEMEDTVTLSFSHPAGFYDSPFNLTVSTQDSEASIWYTLDGSNPQTSSTAIKTGTTATILVDPAGTENRAATPAFLVRASVKKASYKASVPQTQTFLFIEEVKKQGHPGGSWPSDNVNNQLIDLEVDSRLVNDPRYRDHIETALLDIPSISLVTDMENLFDPAKGLYVNPYGRGKAWERAASVELLNPDGSEDFQVNAGIRIRGGYSRRPEVAKHSFRLLFRKRYGDGKLHFPLFGEEGVREYDRMDLRTAQNQAWHEGHRNYTFMRDIFSRDTQRDMGQPYTRSRFYHLYLNGMYWGVYQTQERAEAFFAESYLGGQEEDYDVIKVTSANGYYVEATDGNMETWERIYELTKKGFSANAAYYSLEGKNAEGNPIEGAEVLVDIDNLIDYMLVVFYSGNLDGPSGHFMQNKRANNFYAIYNRADKSRGFQFFTHDSEISMLDLSENRVNIGRRTDNLRMEVADISVFHPQWLHFKLSENPEYRMRFADRAYRHLKEDGTLTPEKAVERLNKRVEELEMAVIGESARWGDTKTSYSLNKTDNWIPSIDFLRNQYLPYRTNIVIEQLSEESLFSGIEPPLVNTAGQSISTPNYSISAPIQIQLEKQSASGEIYYTLNGEDPRTVGGEIAKNATKQATGGTSISLTSTTILKARVYQNRAWSPLRHIDFIATDEDYATLKITELHYHPLDIISAEDTLLGKDYEFIEFKNTGATYLSLAGLELSDAVRYTFPDNAILAPDEFFVVTSKPAKFYQVYGKVASGNFQGNLSNSGETIILKDSKGNMVMQVSYKDKSPWPEKADGTGYSLVSSITSPTEDPDNVQYWSTSQRESGSPFADEEEVLALPSGEAGAEELSIFPNPSGRKINISLDSNRIGENSWLEVSIYTSGGGKVYQKKVRNNGQINLESLGIKGGIYYLKVFSGNSVHTAKIVFLP